MQATLSGTYKTNPQCKNVEFVDRAENLKQYLQEALKAAELEHLEVHSKPPYAYIGNPQKLSVSPPEYFNPLPSNRERRGVRYDKVLLPTGEKVRAVCYHSPKSDNWDNLTYTKKKTIFGNCLKQAGVTHGVAPPMWMLC